MDHTLPYPIPGPAGTLLAPPANNATRNASPSTNALFASSAWHAMLRHRNLPPYGTEKQESSLALLRHGALARDAPPTSADRLRFIPALLTSLTPLGRDATVIIRDPTAALRATVHEEVLRKHGRSLREGAVLLMDNVVALSSDQRKRAGYRLDVLSDVHASIGPDSVIRVFTPCDISPSTRTLSQQSQQLRHQQQKKQQQQQQHQGPDPSAAYSANARNPPPLPLQPHRQSTARVPLSTVTSSTALKRTPERQSGPSLKRPAYQNDAHMRPPIGPPPRSALGPPRRPGLYRPGAPLLPAFQRPGGTGAPGPTVSQAMAVSTVTPTPISNPSTAASRLSDEQLDSLLGEVDVDALIAASGKANAVASAEEVSRMTQSQASGGTERAEAIDGVAMGADESVAKSGVGQNGEMQKEDSNPGRGVSTLQQQTQTGEVATEGINAAGGIASVDQSMIDNLFEGLD